MKKNVLSKLLLAALLVAASLPALAQVATGDPGDDATPARGRGWWNDARVIERVGLTDDQRKKIEERLYDSGQRMIDLRADADKAQLQLSKLLAAADLDDAAVTRAMEQVTGAHCAIERERNQTRVDVARLLTRDQRVALARVLESKRGVEGRRPLMRRR